MNLHETKSTSLGRAVELAQRYRRIVAAVVYAGITTGSLAFGFLVRVDFDFGSLLDVDFAQGLALLVLVRLAVNYQFGLGLSRWRYVGNTRLHNAFICDDSWLNNLPRPDLGSRPTRFDRNPCCTS